MGRRRRQWLTCPRQANNIIANKALDVQGEIENCFLSGLETYFWTAGPSVALSLGPLAPPPTRQPANKLVSLFYCTDTRLNERRIMIIAIIAIIIIVIVIVIIPEVAATITVSWARGFCWQSLGCCSETLCHRSFRLASFAWSLHSLQTLYANERPYVLDLCWAGAGLELIRRGCASARPRAEARSRSPKA